MFSPASKTRRRYSFPRLTSKTSNALGASGSCCATVDPKPTPESPNSVEVRATTSREVIDRNRRIPASTFPDPVSIFSKGDSYESIDSQQAQAPTPPEDAFGGSQPRFGHRNWE